MMDSPWPRAFSPLFIPFGPTVPCPDKQQADRGLATYPNRIRPYSPTTVGLPTDLPYLAEDERDHQTVDKSPHNRTGSSRRNRHLASEIHPDTPQDVEKTGYRCSEGQQQTPGCVASDSRAEHHVDSPPYFLPTLPSKHGLSTPPHSPEKTRLSTPTDWRSYRGSPGPLWDPKSVDFQSHPTQARMKPIIIDLTGSDLEADNAAEDENSDGDLCESLHRVNEQIKVLRKTRADSRKQVRSLKRQHNTVNERLRLVTAENTRLHRAAAYERDQRILFERVVHNLNSTVEQGKDDLVNALREIQCLEDVITRLNKRARGLDDEEEARSTKRRRLM